MIFIEEDQFLSVSVVAMETTRDPVPGKVLQSTQQGWADILEPVFRLNYVKSLQLSHEDGVLLWNSGVVKPESSQSPWLICMHST